MTPTTPTAGRSQRAVGAVLAMVLLGLGVAWWALQQRAPASAQSDAIAATADGAPRVTRLMPAGLERPSTPGTPPTETVTTPQTATQPQALATPTVVVEREQRPATERTRAQRPTPRTVAPARVSEPSAPVRQTSVVATPPVEVVPAPQAPAPAPAQTVDQMCAGSSNFLARDLCRARACRNPGLIGDPVCVRFRAMEEENRRRTQ